jgi:hypothetical protein
MSMKKDNAQSLLESERVKEKYVIWIRYVELLHFVKIKRNIVLIVKSFFSNFSPVVFNVLSLCFILTVSFIVWLII